MCDNIFSQISFADSPNKVRRQTKSGGEKNSTRQGDGEMGERIFANTHPPAPSCTASIVSRLMSFFIFLPLSAGMSVLVALLLTSSSSFLPPIAPLPRAPRAALTSSPRHRQHFILASSSTPASDDASLPQRLKSACRSVAGFVDRRYFLVGVVAAVALAAVYPPLGRRGGPLRPELTVAWGATCGIFLLSGLNLPTSELARAAVSVRLHALIQGFNLLFIPLCTLLSCDALAAAGWLQPALRDGMVVMSLLPTTINMCVALCRSSGGDEALAICARRPRTRRAALTQAAAARQTNMPHALSEREWLARHARSQRGAR